DKKVSKDLNRKIEWVLFGTGPAMVNAFENGQLDAGYMGLPPAIIGINKGVPIKCVAGGHVEGTILIAKEEYKPVSEFKGDLAETLTQFEGKIIGVPSKGSIHEVILTHFLKKFGLIDDISVKDYAQPEFIAIDMKKRILDAGVGTPALAVFAQSLFPSQIIIPAKNLWPYNPSYGIFFHNNVIKNHPEIINGFLKHHKKASELLRTSQSIAADKISQSFGILTKSYVESVLRISPKYCIALTKEYINVTMQFVNKLFELGYIDQKLKLSQIFELRFVEKIHPEESHYDNP
ncbi:MAG: ABC transporter substrate-binding protein, partial [Candidatus Thorarchaeota archaeon]